MSRILLFLLSISGGLTACQSAQTRNANLIADRTEKLRPRAGWSPTWCRVDAHLTGPATARYREIYPADVDALGSAGLPFTWKSSIAACEVMALDRSPLATTYQGLLDTALCLLVQTHLVNSPFEGLRPVAVETRDGQTFLRTGEDQTLGVLLDPKTVRIETRTKAHGTFKVEYESIDGTWLPARLAQQIGRTQIVVDQMEYEPARGGERRRPRGFVINVGEDKARPHSDVAISECRSY